MNSENSIFSEIHLKNHSDINKPQVQDDCIVIRSGLKPLLDDFHLTFGVNIDLYSPSDHLLLQCPAGSQAEYCNAVSSSLVNPKKCIAQVKRMRHVAADRMMPLFFTCHAGMRYCLFPITSIGGLAAIAVIGNFRSGNSPSNEILAKLKRQIADTSSIVTKFDSLVKFDITTEERLVRMFSLITEYSVNKGLIAIRINPLFEKVIVYIRDRVKVPKIGIEDVAHHVHRSQSTVSHVIKKEAGISFSQLVIQEKLKAAENMFATNPVISIGEVANELGYSDQFYFSKLFKKYRGVSPSEYLRAFS